MRRYESQSGYGDNGLRICTVVCHRVAMRFLRSDGGCVMDILTTEAVHAMMMQSVAFYQSTTFPPRFVGMHDVMRLIPPEGAKHMEFGGLLRGGPDYEIDGLFVMPLTTVLRRIRSREGQTPVAFVVTFMEHTIVFLSLSKGAFYLFDPLPAELLDVSNGWEPPGTASEPYSAVMLCIG
jgi:hypothetical protein